MTDTDVVAAARSDPDAQPLTGKQLARMRRVPHVKVLRQRLDMTQVEFAEARCLLHCMSPVVALSGGSQGASLRQLLGE